MSNRTSDDRTDAGPTRPRFSLRALLPVMLAAVGALALAAGVVWLIVPGEPAQNLRHETCRPSLQRLAQALEHYRADFGRFPPAFVADAEGKPMHSWRVLLLPYLDEKDVYQRYDFSQPWDGPANRRLHQHVVPAYQCPVCRSPSPNTTYLAITGPGTPWGTDRPKPTADQEGGPVIVELCNTRIHWLDPRDVPLEEAPAIIGSKGAHALGSHAVLENGIVRFLSNKITVEDLQKTFGIEASPKK